MVAAGELERCPLALAKRCHRSLHRDLSAQAVDSDDSAWGSIALNEVLDIFPRGLVSCA